MWRAEAIMMKIHEEGFRVAMQKELQLTHEQAESFYNEDRGQPYFDELINRMTMYANAMLIEIPRPLMRALSMGFGQF